jgi:hypothetical protein
MTIIVSKNDSVLDVLNKLQNNGFEIGSFVFKKPTGYFSIKVTKDERSIKISNHINEVVVLSNFGYALFSEIVLIHDDLSYEEL